MSFMNRWNSCLVPYRLIPVQASASVYKEELLGPGAMWAEPDITNAAEWMRALVEQEGVRLAIGRNAREAMRRYQDEALRGWFLDELQMILESELAWRIGQERRTARRDHLERWMTEEEPQIPATTWTGKVKSLAKKAGFRRGGFPYWTTPRRSKISGSISDSVTQ
jgi:hypothetical protein